MNYIQYKTPWPVPASELYRRSDRRLSAKLVTIFADRGCHVVSVMDLYGCILEFLDRSPYFFFKVAPPYLHVLMISLSGGNRPVC
jgi:hypothetical protein